MALKGNVSPLTFELDAFWTCARLGLAARAALGEGKWQLPESFVPIPPSTHKGERDTYANYEHHVTVCYTRCARMPMWST